MLGGSNMTIKEIFDKATSENKSLTYEEFKALADADKAKFADLSEGKYVDRQKYDDDIAKKDTEIGTLNDTISTRDADLAGLQEQLQNAGTDAGKLDEVTSQLTSLKAKYDEDTQALSARLSAQAYEFASRDFASSQKFSSAAARRDFEQQLIAKQLPMENGNIMGASDFLKEYAKANKDAFVVEQPKTDPKPTFAAGTNPTDGGKKMTLSEMMAMKNENPNAVISFE